MADDQPKYPAVCVDIAADGPEANAFFVITTASVALRNAGVPERTVHQFEDAATLGSYDEMLATVRQWVTVQ